MIIVKKDIKNCLIKSQEIWCRWYVTKTEKKTVNAIKWKKQKKTENKNKNRKKTVNAIKWLENANVADFIK